MDAVMEDMTALITCDGVQLHCGVGVRKDLGLRRRLEDRSQSWRRDVGDLKGQRGLMETQHTHTHTQCHQ